jgi:2-aminoadipate transaminase
MSRSISGAGGTGHRSKIGQRATAHELARYEALFAARTRTMKSSAMREMMALTEQPDVISLAGGLPDTSTFAPDLFAELFDEIAATSTARALQYGPTEGMAAAVDCVAEVMAAEGTSIDRDEVIVTTGGQQVIDLVCKSLIDPGDVIVAEAPTYPGAIPTFGAYQAQVAQIEMDDDGMPIDELERTLDRLAHEGRRPKFIYTIPNFQNPGGVTMSLERRRALIALARERELLVLEDNPYGLLRYEGEPLPTLYSLDAQAGGSRGGADLVIYLGTFSKILSPGLRLGWAVAPRPVLEKLNLGKQGADLCSSPITQLFVAEYFTRRDESETPAWLAYLDRLRALYSRRRDVMIESLEEHFGERGRWTRPQGGMFIWATLDERIDTTDLLALAQTSERVAFVPGSAAYMDGRSGRSSMRLNFAGNSEERIREGIRRIGRAVSTQVGLISTLTGSRPAAAAKPSGKPPAGGRSRARKEGLADVVELPRRDAGERRARGDR